MRSEWSALDFVVQMPHLAPGGRLSEVEFLKLLGAYQWQGIATGLGRPPSKITSADGERLYASFIDVELKFGDRHSLESLGEDARVFLRNRARFFAKKFVEGLIVIDDKPISDDDVDAIGERSDLYRSTHSWVAMTNAFIAREGSNSQLRVFKPEGVESVTTAPMREPPLGIVQQSEVQSTGVIPDVESGVALLPVSREPVLYPLMPESDVNGAGLTYFARYPAFADYGERIFLAQRLDVPVSLPLISYLSTEHRRLFYFANANPGDRVDVRTTASIVTPDRFVAPGAGVDYRTPSCVARISIALLTMSSWQARSYASR
jgi:probable biosynthetic protein (TIGR04098 family)